MKTIISELDYNDSSSVSTLFTFHFVLTHLYETHLEMAVVTEAWNAPRPQPAAIFNRMLRNIQGSGVRHWVSATADGNCTS